MKNKYLKRSMILFMLLFAFLMAVPTSAAIKTGFQLIDGKTYYIKSDGTKQIGWLTLNGKKYYFNSSGVQVKGWLTTSGGKRYFSSNSGVLTTGWLSNSTGKRYFHPSTGIMYVGLKKIGSYYYYFDPKTGYMKTGWVADGKNKRYFNKNGIMLTGWVTDSKGNKRYFNTKTGIMLTGWVSNSAGGKRYFDPSTGCMFIGLKKVGTYYYFFQSNGLIYKGWYTNGKGNKRYFDKTNGQMARGKVVVDGVTYYFNSSTGILENNSNYGLNYTTATIAPRGYFTLKLNGASAATWTSSNPNIVKVSSSSGSSVTVTGVSIGTATVTAKVSGSVYECRVTCSKTIKIPAGLGTYYTYMGWQCITATGSDQYKLLAAALKDRKPFTSEGFGCLYSETLNAYVYVIALTPAYGKIGDLMKVTLANGRVIYAFIGDFKNYNDSGCTIFGHDNSNNVVEFVVNKDNPKYPCWYGGGSVTHSNPGTSSCRPEWGGTQVASIQNLGYNFMTGEF